MGQVPCGRVSQFPSNLLFVTLASFPHILTIPAIVSFLGNSGESVKINKGELIAVMLCTQPEIFTSTSRTEANLGMHLTQYTCQERLPCKMFLVFIREIVGLLLFTFTMSNYSDHLLSGCDKQLGSYLVLLHEAILGLTRMATEHWLPKIRSLM